MSPSAAKPRSNRFTQTGEHGFRHRRRLGHPQHLGDRQAGAGGSEAIVDIAAPVTRAQTLLPIKCVASLPCRDDRSGNFEARNIARSRWWRIKALALDDIRPVHPGGGDLDQYLALARARVGRDPSLSCPSTISTARITSGMISLILGPYAQPRRKLIDLGLANGQRCLQSWTKMISSRASPATR